jgi:hypothetical protein
MNIDRYIQIWSRSAASLKRPELPSCCDSSRTRCKLFPELDLRQSHEKTIWNTFPTPSDFLKNRRLQGPTLASGSPETISAIIGFPIHCFRTGRTYMEVAVPVLSKNPAAQLAASINLQTIPQMAFRTRLSNAEWGVRNAEFGLCSLLSALCSLLSAHCSLLSALWTASGLRRRLRRNRPATGHPNASDAGSVRHRSG